VQKTEKIVHLKDGRLEQIVGGEKEMTDDEEGFTAYDISCANLVLNILEVILLGCILMVAMWG
jgi:hypothetical protein